MTIRLSRYVAEYESHILNYIWEPPNIFEIVKQQQINIIYGRKGSGKSTLIDYISASEGHNKIITIRTRNTDLFSKIIATLNEAKEEPRVIEESISSAIQFIIYTSLMRNLIEPVTVPRPGSYMEKIYKFLVQNELHQGSVFRRAIQIISTLDGKLKICPNIQNILKISEGFVSYEEALYALIEYLHDSKTYRLICIDDVDEVGFSFSEFDRFFVNSILSAVIRSNVRFLESGSNIRALLSIPTELYRHASLWGGDWASHSSAHLVWSNSDMLQSLVNKRIAVEFNIRSRNPRFDDDRYSISKNYTWLRVFPDKVRTTYGVVNAFEYVLRHTFYTPRHLLGLLDMIISRISKQIEIPGSIDKITEKDWSTAFSDSVEEFTYSAVKNWMDLYSLIYDGLDEILEAFTSRPNVWKKSQLQAYLIDSEINLVRKDSNKTYKGAALIKLLYKLGFLGLGVKEDASPIGVDYYRLHFSFIDQYEKMGGWDICVISPLFTYMCELNEFANLYLVPHKRLVLRNKNTKLLQNYDFESNSVTV